MANEIALDSQGIQIQRGDGGSPENFTLIPKIMSFNGPGGQADVRDRTTLDSTAKEKGMGLRDEGQLSFDMLYIPTDAQHKALLQDRANKSLRNFRIVYTDAPASKDEFTAYVVGFTKTGSVGADLRVQVTLEISGSVTTTAGA